MSGEGSGGFRVSGEGSGGFGVVRSTWHISAVSLVQNVASHAVPPTLAPALAPPGPIPYAPTFIATPPVRAAFRA